MGSVKKISYKKLLCLLPAIFMIFHAGFGQIQKIWALGDGEKVYRFDQDHPQMKSNSVWDGETIRLKGLYNEVLAFQVIVETGIQGARGIELSVKLPVHKASGKVIGGSTLKYGPDGTVEIFTQHYLQVKDPTQPNWYYGSAAAQPEKITGWIPDALIPTDALRGRGGLPLDIPEIDTTRRPRPREALQPVTERMQNQGFWIDVHLPRDMENYPSGLYLGKVVITEGGAVRSEIPLEITLLPQYLLDENTSDIWMYTGDVSDYFPEIPQDQLDELIKFECHRHRMDAVGGFSVHRSVFDQKLMDAYRPYLDGSAFTPAYGYHGPGEGVGEKTFPIGMYGSITTDLLANPHEEPDRWVEWFDKNNLDVAYFWYIIDEPDSSLHPWLKEQIGKVKSNPGVGKRLPVFTTTGYKEALDGYIDVWSGYDGVDLSVLLSLREKGGNHGFYNGNRPRYGSLILEGAAVDFRVNSWIMYKYDLSPWFIWHSTHWRHNHQGPKGHLHQNVYQNPLTFINDQLEFGNGDGVFFYPGRMPFYPEQDRGLNAIFPSIRLKNIRRGQQDAVILKMAEKKVGREKVMTLVNKVVPKAMSEVPMKDPVPWSQRGDDYDKVREELLELL